MDEVSEYATLEQQAFKDAVCIDEYEIPNECVVRRAKNGESLDGFYEGKSSLSDGSRNEWKMYEITCTYCGISMPLDVLETNNPEYDDNKNMIQRQVMSKTGAERRKVEAREQMDSVAKALNYDNKMIIEANRLFNALHKGGGSSGGRGYKTVAAAALWLASINAGTPLSETHICRTHPEKPQPKVVRRLVKDAKANNLIPKLNRFTASEKLEIIAAQMNADPQIVEFAKPYAALQLRLTPGDQAAAALYLAAGMDGTRENNYSGVAIMLATGINRRRIYRAAKVMQPIVKKNPPKEKPTRLPSTVIKELRRIRKQ